MNVMQKKLLILGSNHLCCEIVYAAKEMGVSTIVTDWNSVENAPAKLIADKHYEISLADIDDILELISTENIDGVITGFADSYLKYYAEICSRAGLPCYGTAEQFDIFCNKDKFKAKCREFGVPTIEEYDTGRLLNDVTYLRSADFPLLLKPADNSGGRGVTICRSPEEFSACYEKAKVYSPSATVLSEQFIEGREVTAFYLFDNGEIYLSGLANRLIGAQQTGVIKLPVGYSFPSDLLPYYEKDIYPNVKNMYKAMGLQNGMLFMQCLIGKDNVCRVYDIGYRLTGSLEFILSEKVVNVNAIKAMINFALYGKMFPNGVNQTNLTANWPNYAFNITILSKPGKIQNETGRDKLSGIDGVVTFRNNHKPGEVIPEESLGTLNQVVMRVFCVCKEKNDIWRIVEEIKNVYDMTNENGESMLLPVFDTKEIYLR